MIWNSIFPALILAAYAGIVTWRYIASHNSGRYADCSVVTGTLVGRSADRMSAGSSLTGRQMQPQEPQLYDYLIPGSAEAGDYAPEDLERDISQAICSKYPLPPEKRRKRHTFPVVGHSYSVYILEDKRGNKSFQYTDEDYWYDRISGPSLFTVVLTDLCIIAGIVYLASGMVLSLMS